jgi:hypothetical protein
MHWLVGVWLVLLVGIVGFIAGVLKTDYEYNQRPPQVVTKVVVERVEVVKECPPPSTYRHQYRERP